MKYFCTYGCNGVGDVDGRKTGTFPECIISDGCDGIGDVYTGQAPAVIKGIFADGGYGVSCTTVCDRVRNGYDT